MYTRVACTLYLLLIVCHGLPSRKRLSKHIFHHDTLNYDRQAVQLQHERMRRSTLNGDVVQNHWKPLKIQFTALDREFSLLLFPGDDILAPGADFVVHSADGSKKANFDSSVLYKGSLEHDQGSSVHGYILDGIFDGVITTQQEEYHIEVAEKFFNQPGEFHSVIYAVSDVDFSAINGSQASCGGSGKAYEKLREIQSTAAKPTAKQLHSFRTKRALSPDNRFCLVYVAADQLFYDNVGRSDDTVTMSEIATRMTSVNGIFSGTDFDFDGGVDSIGFHIGRIGILRSSDPGYRYGAANIAVTDFLDLWSQENHDEFCLALLLTYRDFDGGVLGLAWVAEAPGGNRGGICETRLRLSVGQRNLNSAIVTFLNFGNTQPRPVTIITMAHEFGHNFGSPHDPNPSSDCSPGGSQGNFLMFPSATDGNLPNNNRFSPCSRRSILAVLSTKSDCFQGVRQFCGNGIIEGNETCDCGSPTECPDRDPCCRADMTCQLISSAVCTPQNAQTVCCTEQCQYVTAASNQECSSGTDCARSANCNSASALCPDPNTSSDGTLCNDDRNTCFNGDCVGSVCFRINQTECQCTEDSDQLCDVCCTDNSTGTERCVSTYQLMNINGTRKASGRSCNDFTGYCDDSGVCIGVNTDDLLNQIRDIFSIDSLNNVVEWLEDYWWIVVIVAVVIIVIIIALPLTYRKKKPIKRILRRASTLRRQPAANNAVADAQAGGIGTSRQRVARRQQRGERQQVLTANEGLQRLKRFFPTVDNDTIMSVMRAKKNEQKSVKQLLALGFPLKKQP